MHWVVEEQVHMLMTREYMQISIFVVVEGDFHGLSALLHSRDWVFPNTSADGIPSRLSYSTTTLPSMVWRLGPMPIIPLEYITWHLSV
jgi:hypothetical protein